MTVSLERARAAKAAIQKTLENLDTVTGVGITRVGDDYAVKVNLREAGGDAADIPSHVDGVPVRVEVTGTIRPRA
ncbi:MAG TPA: hypothetical protein VEX86_24955 [Longimicrobium sp.]|nr:hypothetical protein [Longimicrobium sp.]